jgi:AcrR family transcriptional regulator
MPRPRLHDYDQLRQALLDAGGRILAGQGPHALTLRRVASEVGTSTTAVYTLFGDKAGLVLAMFLEGAARLERVFAAVPRTDDPVADLFQLGLAYRANARANPHLYELLFGQPIPEFTPDEAAVRHTRGTFEDLVRAISRCIDAGRFTPTDPYEVAVHLNALVHGLASLELLGRLGAAQEADRRWHAALHATLRGYQPREPPNGRLRALGTG